MSGSRLKPRSGTLSSTPSGRSIFARYAPSRSALSASAGQPPGAWLQGTRRDSEGQLEKWVSAGCDLHPLTRRMLFWNSLICLKASENLVGVFGSFDHYSPKTS